jgi:Protein of unknown function (DUF3365)
MRFSPSAALLPTLLLTACSSNEATQVSWTEVPGVINEQHAQLELANSAKQEMMKTLMATLSAEMASGGPAAAITVCKERAPEVAAEVGAKLGVTIGRTSFKLRNPANAAPEWALPLLEDRPKEARYAASSDGALGVTLPIMLQPGCLACHGEVDALPDEIRTALKEMYPEDQATGFAAGDLRGWFWVEVPAKP